MKKSLFVFLLALCIAVAPMALAEKTFKAQLDGKDFFSLSVDDSYIIEEYGEEGAEEDGYIALGVLQNDDAYVYISTLHDDEYEGFNMFSASEDEIKEYLDYIMEDLAEYGAEEVGIYNAEITVNNQKVKIPFVIVRIADEEGQYYYAETMTSGYAITIEISPAEEGAELRDYELEELKRILDGFMPAA
ncbi:MAG: hypothetical protein PHI27_00375 [Eubacteriales bacterium]|nr:hypothetical protein [Eubacteriales bacterium]MDD3880689.1 hypothetical protein [Eubacteriales bacterium]MDD4511677.1 hypothetical protein [Eubacteriales bacterium]